MTDTNTSGADVLAVIPNAETIRELLRQRRWVRNCESTAAKYDAEIAKYPADDVARIAFEDALHVATGQFKDHFRNRYAANGLPPIPTPEPMDRTAVAALIEREAALVAEVKALRDALRNLLWAASERDKRNRIRQFDDFMRTATELLARASAATGGDSDG